MYPDQVFIYDQHRKLIKKLVAGKMNDMTVDRRGHIYVGNDRGVKVFDRSGGIVRSFGAPAVDSIAVLRDGRIVVASPDSQGLIHIYNPEGQWLLSAGRMMSFDSNPKENRWLNSGKIVVGLSDEIYYVFKNSPRPLLLKFSSTGQLIISRKITGEAINIQVERQLQFLHSERMSNRIGGFLIIRSVTVEPETGHVWVAFSGSPTSGVIYEFSPEGVKLRELNLVVNSNRPVYAAGALCMAEGTMYAILDGGQAYAFDLSKPVNNTEIIRQLDFGGCPASANYDCSQSCPGAAAKKADCKADVDAHKGPDDIVTASDCNTSADPDATCGQAVTFCNTKTGVKSTYNTTQTQTCTEAGCDVGTPCVDEVGCEGCDDHCFCTSYNPHSPVLVDINGDGFALTNLAGGVWFDLDVRGRPGHTPWTASNSDDAFLVLDRNGNGMIDDGIELFGDLTPQPSSQSPNGFLALTEFDKPGNGGNGDRRIDTRDSIFSSLRLWQDSNHNGVSEPSELHTLPSLNISAISLEYKESRQTDQYGNQFRFRAKVYDQRGAHVGRWAWDVFFVARP